MKAAKLDFDEIKIGQIHTFKAKIDKEKLLAFFKLSGDYNPLHSDPLYAAKTKFGKQVIPGMLLASFFSQLVGMHLPGENCLYLGQSLLFKNPGFLDEELMITGKVINKSVTKIITLETRITNESGKVLVEGEARVLYR